MKPFSPRLLSFFVVGCADQVADKASESEAFCDGEDGIKSKTNYLCTSTVNLWKCATMNQFSPKACRSSAGQEPRRPFPPESCAPL